MSKRQRIARSPEDAAKVAAAMQARSAGLSDAARAAMGDGGRNRVLTDEARGRISAAAKGHSVSAATRAKISAAAKGRVVSDATRAKLAAAAKGRPVSDATRAKLAASSARREQTAAFRAKMRDEALARLAHANLRQNSTEVVERTERLRVLWDEGHSTAEIGRRMGVTKNAVIGKAHRLGLPGRPSLIGRRADPAQVKRQDKPQRAAKVKVPVLAVVTRPYPVQRPGQWRPAPILSSDPCSFPTTMPNGRHSMLCEGLAERGRSYCPEHAARCLAGPQLRPKAQDKLAVRHG